MVWISEHRPHEGALSNRVLAVIHGDPVGQERGWMST